MSGVVFFLEEASARVLLEGVWPRLVSPELPIYPQYRVFEGKQDLERQLERKLRPFETPKLVSSWFATRIAMRTAEPSSSVCGKLVSGPAGRRPWFESLATSLKRFIWETWKPSNAAWAFQA